MTGWEATIIVGAFLAVCALMFFFAYKLDRLQTRYERMLLLNERLRQQLRANMTVRQDGAGNVLPFKRPTSDTVGY